MFSDYRFDIFWLRLRLTYVFWLPIWYLVITTPLNMCFLITDLISSDYHSAYYMFSDYLFDILWLRLCLIYVFWLPIWYLVITTPLNICFLITDLISCDYHSVYYIFSDYRFDILWLRLRLIYVFWLPIWYLVITTPFNICFLITDLIYCDYDSV
jgi:uncharacterized membrane protein YbaN (DUF454 family)